MSIASGIYEVIKTSLTYVSLEFPNKSRTQWGRKKKIWRSGQYFELDERHTTSYRELQVKLQTIKKIKIKSIFQLNNVCKRRHTALQIHALYCSSQRHNHKIAISVTVSITEWKQNTLPSLRSQQGAVPDTTNSSLIMGAVTQLIDCTADTEYTPLTSGRQEEHSGISFLFAF